tara:strand:- start:7993 stop:8406 length:414 start_codon:yes stop_codon:yes gene_type:complete
VRNPHTLSSTEGSLASLILADKPVACTGSSSNIPSSLSLSSLDEVFGVPKYHGVTADLSYNQYLKFPAIIVYYNVIFFCFNHALTSSDVAHSFGLFSFNSICLNISFLSEALEYSIPSLSVNTTSAVSITSCHRAFL